ncbi:MULTISPECIES: 3-oxoacid CoA-transferase subunit B [Bacillaceae]|uniref:3-oxoacid CoA-transferase subunit B n=2 Tax=Gottfriedia TaxID=2837503 RepID=A0ABY4JLC9_9BACI|nr:MULTISPECIES: 3-oxoacid CoA-transferase subunit B [Bacillaceae]ODG93057.1 acyl CoA:acetate/3-ketoacid CoA transferase subunit beta [Gottfriedia luciferensis]PFH82800.1 CoA transferase subunit B [Bacillus sp. AFS088145]PGZ92908.1 CoA transferase subunit B [Bacillus sp. AFS029533]UPM54646.1 3-oxoacid CoA-transferase subunit B [Gottfriedia acidiceleris]SFD07234.1 acetate CoA/acetoacetate CoA-transferase beta subunit [Bacillus sp. UNCCL81]
MGMGIDFRQKIAMRAAKEIKNGMIVNLGIGIPSIVPDYLPEDVHVMFHAENGVMGIGPSPEKGKEDENLCNAGGFPITVLKGSSYFDSATAFGIIRRGLLDLTVLGALQVSEKGDLANWIVPGKRVPGIGGAMDLAQKAKRVIVVMNHTDKAGNPKIVKECSLPLTSKSCVDLIITEMAVIEVVDDTLVLKELMSPYTVEDVIEKTGAKLEISTDLKMFI